jgi:hypothetical protein
MTMRPKLQTTLAVIVTMFLVFLCSEGAQVLASLAVEKWVSPTYQLYAKIAISVALIVLISPFASVVAAFFLRRSWGELRNMRITHFLGQYGKKVISLYAAIIWGMLIRLPLLIIPAITYGIRMSFWMLVLLDQPDSSDKEIIEAAKSRMSGYAARYVIQLVIVLVFYTAILGTILYFFPLLDDKSSPVQHWAAALQGAVLNVAAMFVTYRFYRITAEQAAMNECDEGLA